MTITLQAVNELIQSLESAGELSIREQKFLKLAKEFRICSASLDAAIKTGNMLADQNAQLAAENVGLKEAIPQLKNIDYQNESMDDVTLAEEIGFNAAVMAMHRWVPKTTVTDRIVAEAEARGVEKAIAHLEKKFSNIGVQIMNLQWLADSLREGAGK
ncbi:TPA: hypothetical protein MDU84_002736 [Klebsiella pneumoniae]|nr:hypothetical protein [Klebsiella pneumoniae]